LGCRRLLADAVAPGVPGALWLTSYPPNADPSTAAGMAREVSIADRPLGPQFKLHSEPLTEAAWPAWRGPAIIEAATMIW
jgi:hypothetical protein